MQAKKFRQYEIVTWQDVREQIRGLNPELVREIDEIDPPASWKLVKARYAFGDELLQNGELFVPHEGELIGINDPRFNPELRSLLDYTCMPIGMNLQGTTEVFADCQENPIPLSFMIPGRFYALWLGLDEGLPFFTRFWSMVAGTRSLFFLPRITDSTAMKRLQKEFGAAFPIPHNLWDQPKFLKKLDVYNPESWFLETLFFSEIWFSQGIKQKALRSVLLDRVWRSTRFLRTNIFFDVTFSQARLEKNIKIDPYLIDTIKHLYYMGVGAYPGFVFANSDMVGPISFFQKVFNEIYQLQYTPTLMHLDYLRPELQKSLFYSLQLPTLLEFSPKSHERATQIDELYFIEAAIKRLHNYINAEKERLSGLDLLDWSKQVQYNYYHSHPSDENTIQPITKLIQTEPILLAEQIKYQKPFCETNSFMRGVIKLSIT